MYNSDPRKTEVFRTDSGDEDVKANAGEDAGYSEGWQCFRHLPYLTEEAKANLK